VGQGRGLRPPCPLGQNVGLSSVLTSLTDLVQELNKKPLTPARGNGIVQIMNDKGDDREDYRSFLLLDELSRNNELTQRDLSKRLGVALGLINSYLKNLAAKGYITVSTIPRNRYKYYLTPSGFAEKTRLTYRHLQNFTGLYRIARRDFSALFRKLKAGDASGVVFCGVDEVAEIAYLSLKEAGLELAAVVDDRAAGKGFFGLTVAPIGEIRKTGYGVVVITSFSGGEALKKSLAEAGVAPGDICDISAEGWIKRLNNIEDSVEDV